MTDEQTTAKTAENKTAEQTPAETAENQKRKRLSPKAAGVKTVLRADGHRYVIVGVQKPAELADTNGRRVTHLDNTVSLRTAFLKNNAKKMVVTNADHAIPGGLYKRNPIFDLPLETDVNKAGTDPMRLGRAAVNRCLEHCPNELRGSLAVQVACNIADIDKLIAPYLNNVICALNRMKAADMPEKDFFGNFQLSNDYARFCEMEEDWKKERVTWYAKSSRMNSFGSEFAAKYDAAKEKKVYSVLWLLSYLRQMTVHHDTDAGFLYLLEPERLKNDAEGSESYERRKWDAYFDAREYEPEERAAFRRAREQAVTCLDGIYQRKLNSFQDGFLGKARINLWILAKVLGIRDDDAYAELLKQYYLFCETKEVRCEGYSVRCIRERILETYHDRIVRQLQGEEKLNGKEKPNGEEKLISERQKINTLIDMLITCYYREHSAEKDAMIAKLRTLSRNKGEEPTESAEEDRQSIYEKEAKKIWRWKADADGMYTTVYSAMYYLKNPQNWNCPLRPCARTAFEKIRTSASISRFSEFFYLLSLFLDGKEINTMLTRMIAKFESIAELLDTEKALEGVLADDQKIIFREEYEFFTHSREIAAELRRVNSLARMTGKKGKLDDVKAKKAAYFDAAELLGWDGTREELNQYLNDKMLDKEYIVEYQQLSNQYLNDKMPDKENSVEYQQLSVSPDKHSTGFRNFICANVIDNARFRYLIRCGAPGEFKKLAKNRELVRFVLRQMPRTQLERYASLCEADPKNAVDALTDVIQKISLQDFEGVETAARRDAEKAKATERAKTMVSLYLTVLYILVKNVFTVNYRYVLAFNQLDRDMSLALPAEEYENRQNNENYYNQLTDQYLAATLEYAPKTEYFRKALARLRDGFHDGTQTRAFRNFVEHLDIAHALCKFAQEITCPTSYYAIYHYCMQRKLFSNHPLNGDEYEIDRTNLTQYHTYSRDAVKRFCYPFGYNIPRYRNLTDENLFRSLERKQEREKDTPDKVPTAREEKKEEKKKEEKKKEEEKPVVLYHVTAADAKTLAKIKDEGLRPKRNADKPSPYRRRIGSEMKVLIHLRAAAADGSPVTAMPRKKERETVVLTIDAKKMREDGILFYRDRDDSYLVESVPAEYIRFPENA